MLKTIRSRARTATAKEAAEKVECQWPAPKAVAFPFVLERSARMPRDGPSPVSTRVFPQLVDFAARQIRQDRRFDYHVSRTRHANLEVLCVCSNVRLPS